MYHFWTKLDQKQWQQQHNKNETVWKSKPWKDKNREGQIEGPYAEENWGGVTKDGSGYFSSRIPTITSESETHFPLNLTTGTFPSGLTSKNLTTK